MKELIPTERTQVKRRADRGVYDVEQIHGILDAGYLCHVGFVVEGQPYVIPTGYARVGDRVYIHGSAASRMLQSLSAGIDVCVTVTLVDGFVLARATFRHSMNYRSVVILGKAVLVTDPLEKREALRAFTNHILPGRWEETRQPNETEMMATTVLALPLDEVSAKVRTGPPMDMEDDRTFPVWAGVVPIRMMAGEPVADSYVPAAMPAVDTRRFGHFFRK